jgi:hypothetical protein
MTHRSAIAGKPAGMKGACWIRARREIFLIKSRFSDRIPDLVLELLLGSVLGLLVGHILSRILALAGKGGGATLGRK